MADYREIAEGYNANIGSSNDAVRLFYYDPGNADFTQDLPDYGDEHPDFPGLLVTNLNYTQLNGHPTKQKITVSYKPADTPEGGGEDLPQDTDFNLLPRKQTLGGEMQSITNGTLYWLSDGEQMNQPGFRRIVKGTYSIQQKVGDRDAANALVLANVGKVNANDWEGFDAETLLYIGATADEQLDKDGEKEWLFEHSWAIRIVTFTDNADGWNYAWREDNNTWDKVDISTGGAGGLYNTTDFQALFPGI